MQNRDLNEILIFIKVIESGSFTKASKTLQVPVSTVSAKVASLEKRLGVTLIQRTTRQLRLTSQGEQYFQQTSKGLNEILTAEENLTIDQNEPQGTIRITTPVYLGNGLLPRIIQETAKRYPKINIEAVLKDESLDLLTHGIDVALRTGDLKDSSLISRKLGLVHFAPFASKSYLKKKESISHPKDLLNHVCIIFSGTGKNKWDFSNKKLKTTVLLQEKIVVDDLALAKNLALNGQGIALLPTFSCENEIKAGELVRLLPDWKSLSRPIYLIHLPHRFPTPKLKVFLDLCFESVKKQLQGTECEL